MATVNVDKPVWKSYFDSISKLLQGKPVEIDVASLDIGVQPAAAWVPLFGITYDPQDDLIAIMGEGLDHMVRRPREVYADSQGLDLHSMEIVDGDGVRRIIRFREPLLLPAPHPAPSP